MPVQQIPLRSDLDHYDFTVDLSGRTYLFEIDWNDRAATWNLIIRNTAGRILVGALPLRVDTDLTSRFVNPELPPGVLILFDTSGRGREAEKHDLGTRCVLLYRGFET